MKKRTVSLKISKKLELKENVKKFCAERVIFFAFFAITFLLKRDVMK